MNRRDFFKGLILLPTMADLLPRLADKPAQLQSPIGVQFANEGFVVLESITHSLELGFVHSTKAVYRGTNERLKQMYDLATKSESVMETTIEFDRTEIHDMDGFVVCVAVMDWGRFSLTLRGCWIARHGLGVVEKGDSGLRALT